jgi:Transposase IS4
VLGEKGARNRFGQLWKSSWVCGTVEAVMTAKKHVREQISLDVTWEIGEFRQRKTLKVINVRAGSWPPAAQSLNETMEIEEDQETADNADRDEQDKAGRQGLVSTVSIPDEAENLSRAHHGHFVSIHGYEWHRAEVLAPIGGPIRRRSWVLSVPGGRFISERSDFISARPLLEYFLAVLPLKHIWKIVDMTNENLKKNNQQVTTPSEILKIFGVMVLMTRFEFSKRDSLWSSRRTSKFIPPVELGITGMSRTRFRDMRAAIRFSEQGDETEMTSSQHRWSLVTGFVDAINSHRKEFFEPSELICVDESISRWYGLGGSWIDKGLPHYVAIDRKPESGCEIQNSACGRSGIMLQLKLVVSREDENFESMEEDMLHGTKVLSELVAPWAGSKRIVCADSYFSSVQAAEHLLSMDLKFIGVIKTATRKFPMQALGCHQMGERGERMCFVNKDSNGDPRMLAMVWLDRERRYFVATASSAADGKAYTRVRWRQLEDGPRKVEINVPQPEVSELYYSCCAAIDKHNRCRQADLGLEKKFQVKEWSFRVNSSLLAMLVVDAWMIYTGAVGDYKSMSQSEFYETLATELIENKWDGMNLRQRITSELEAPRWCDRPRSGISAHLTPTKRKRKNKEGETLPYALFGNCVECKRSKSRFLCSVCSDDDGNMCKIFLCNSSTGRPCFQNHVQSKHPDMVL